MLAMSWPFEHMPVPTVDDLWPEFNGREAIDVIAALIEECSAGRLVYYRDRYQWIVRTPAAVVPGRNTIPLKVWAVRQYPTIRLDNCAPDRMTEPLVHVEDRNAPSSDSTEAPPDLAYVDEDDWMPSIADFHRVGPTAVACEARATFLAELATDCLWPYRVHGEWQVWVVEGRRMPLGDWIRDEFPGHAST